ncbi:MAG: phosphoribosyltransferase family protein [Paludibacter sp.]|nr:phosphoribosyltransferase family protein [Paludibacter sp.]
MEKNFNILLTRFRDIDIPEEFDMIVAIANGGIIPAGILNQRLNIEFQTIKINLRDSAQQPKYDMPKLLSPVDFDFAGKRILLVDDRVKTGSTIEFAKEILKDAAVIKTFAVNGNADYALYDEACFRFPWIL